MRLTEFARVLRPKGELIFSMLHPCCWSVENGWIKDEEGNYLYFRIDCYFDLGALEEVPWVDEKTRMIACHHTVEDVGNDILDAGVVLRRLVELVPPPAYYDGYPERLNYGRIPFFLAVRAEKA